MFAYRRLKLPDLLSRQDGKIAIKAGADGRTQEVAAHEALLGLRRDVEAMRRELLKYQQSLERPGALSIIQSEKWTPTLTFATPGDLNVVYSTRVGDILKTDWGASASFRIVTSTFTHTTAAGSLQVTGFPYIPSADTGFVWDGACAWSGITKAGYTSAVAAMAAGSATITFSASGSGVAIVNLAAGDLPTGGAVVLRGRIDIRR